MPFCKYCGASQDADALFCTECGKQIAKRTDSDVGTNRTPDHPNTPIVKAEAKMETVAREDILPGGPISEEKKERLRAYYTRVENYLFSLNVVKGLFRQYPESFGEEEWTRVEALIAEEYGISEISLYREFTLPDFTKEQASKPAEPVRRNRTYTKRNTEYWAKFDMPKKDE